MSENNMIPKSDMSSVCGMHYEEYWYATHILKTMSQEDFDKWLSENCYKCRNMSDVCMKDHFDREEEK